MLKKEDSAISNDVNEIVVRNGLQIIYDQYSYCIDGENYNYDIYQDVSGSYHVRSRRGYHDVSFEIRKIGIGANSIKFSLNACFNLNKRNYYETNVSQYIKIYLNPRSDLKKGFLNHVNCCLGFTEVPLKETGNIKPLNEYSYVACFDNLRFQIHTIGKDNKETNGNILFAMYGDHRYVFKLSLCLMKIIISFLAKCHQKKTIGSNPFGVMAVKKVHENALIPLSYSVLNMLIEKDPDLKDSFEKSLADELNKFKKFFVLSYLIIKLGVRKNKIYPGLIDSIGYYVNFDSMESIKKTVQYKMIVCHGLFFKIQNNPKDMEKESKKDVEDFKKDLIPKNYPMFK